jgi:hypothetical protein
VFKHPAGTPPSDLLRASTANSGRGHAGPPGEGVITWTATRIALRGMAAQLPAGIDGEAVLDRPIVCEIRPHAMQVRLPRRTAGIPMQPAPQPRAAGPPAVLNVCALGAS